MKLRVTFRHHSRSPNPQIESTRADVQSSGVPRAWRSGPAVESRSTCILVRLRHHSSWPLPCPLSLPSLLCSYQIELGVPTLWGLPLRPLPHFPFHVIQPNRSMPFRGRLLFSSVHLPDFLCSGFPDHTVRHCPRHHLHWIVRVRGRYARPLFHPPVPQSFTNVQAVSLSWVKLLILPASELCWIETRLRSLLYCRVEECQ